MVIKRLNIYTLYIFYLNIIEIVSENSNRQHYIQQTAAYMFRLVLNYYYM